MAAVESGNEMKDYRRKPHLDPAGIPDRVKLGLTARRDGNCL